MMPIRSTRLRMLAAYAASAAALFVAGCAATPPDHFYTLSGREGATLYHPSAAEAAPFYIEVTDATIPDDVAREQMVLDLGDGRVTVVEHQRWIGPLSTEISHSVSDYLTRSLHTHLSPLRQKATAPMLPTARDIASARFNAALE